MVDDLRADFTQDRKSKDGLNRKLFPLTTAEQGKYRFQLAGEEIYHGLPVYRVTFTPKEKSADLNLSDESGPWEGEVLVSREDYQPALVSTKLAQKVPLVIRTALGTNIHGLGFSVRYEKFDDGIWFPVSYGTEFRVRALFFYNRSIMISLENSGFQRARVDTSIEFEADR
jgi:hypothetical protein